MRIRPFEFAVTVAMTATAVVDASGAAAVRAVGRVAVRGCDRGEIVLELAPPSKIRVEVHEPRGGIVAAFDGEQAWAIDRAGRLRSLPVPPALAGEITALVEAAAEAERPGIEQDRRWRGRLPVGRRERDVEIAFEGRVDGSGIAFPACIEIGEPGAAPEIVIDLTRIDADPDVDPGSFAPPAP